MSNAKHSPTPWHLAPGDNPVDVSRTVDADGYFLFGDNCGPAKADAALIVEAVNERDKLRDLLRRLCDEWESSDWAAPEYHPGRELIREAREAIGEGNR